MWYNSLCYWIHKASHLTRGHHLTTPIFLAHHADHPRPRLSDQHVDFPSINPAYSTKPYRFSWCVGGWELWQSFLASPGCFQFSPAEDSCLFWIILQLLVLGSVSRANISSGLPKRHSLVGMQEFGPIWWSLHFLRGWYPQWLVMTQAPGLVQLRSAQATSALDGVTAPLQGLVKVDVTGKEQQQIWLWGVLVELVVQKSGRLLDTDLGGFHKWGYHGVSKNGRFTAGRSHWNGWLGGTPILGNLHMRVCLKTGNTRIWGVMGRKKGTTMPVICVICWFCLDIKIADTKVDSVGNDTKLQVRECDNFGLDPL